MKENYEMIVSCGVKNFNFGRKGILSLAGIKVTGLEILVANNILSAYFMTAVQRLLL